MVGSLPVLVSPEVVSSTISVSEDLVPLHVIDPVSEVAASFHVAEEDNCGSEGGDVCDRRNTSFFS